MVCFQYTDNIKMKYAEEINVIDVEKYYIIRTMDYATKAIEKFFVQRNLSNYIWPNEFKVKHMKYV